MPTIIFKETEACNSNCIYCDVVNRKKPKTISKELLEIVFDNINNYLIKNPKQQFEIIWHGGEPCVAGKEFFNNVINIQKNKCPETSDRINHAVQSNLTLIDQDFIDLFIKLGLKMIGTSYDPIQGIRGFGKNRDSIAYNKSFFNGINILEKNNIQWGFIYVVTKRVIKEPLKIFYILSNMKLSGNFNFHPVLLLHNKDEYDVGITPSEYANFLGTIFQIWWQHRHIFSEVDPFKNYLNLYLGKGNLNCNDSGSCAYSHVYIGPEGNLSHCGRTSDWDVISYGNIKERTLIDVFNDDIRKILKSRKSLLRENDCKNCEYFNICNGGCPIDSWNKHGDFLHKTEWCSVNKIFLKKYFEPITGLKPNFKEFYKNE